MLKEKIETLINDYHKKRIKGRVGRSNISALDVFNIKTEFNINKNKKVIIENIHTNHLNLLVNFKKHLNKKSQDLFCPYPWSNKKKLKQALLSAIKNSKNKIDTSFIIKSNNIPIGHFFLWKAGGNPHSQKHNIQIPELGVAISNKHQGQGLGSLAVKFLQIVAHNLQADAIELTTAISNNGGWHVYKKMGFEYTGDIMNPLEVDVTDEINNRTNDIEYRTEKQMVYIINKEKKTIF